jgi:K+-sensing histidine kinase KdpD
MSSTQNPVTAGTTRDVPWNDVVRFIRQLSHDLRNHLNAIELQSTFLAELASNAEQKAEIQRLREMTHEMSAALQKLTTALGPSNPRLMSYRAADFVEDLREKVEAKHPQEKNAIEWNVKFGDETFQVDPQLLQSAFTEIFDNAFYHERTGGNLKVSAGIEGDRFIFELSEPKKDFANLTENWGGQPLMKVGRGHYGLGLHRVRAIIEAHEGQLQARYVSASSSLCTSVTLPLSRNVL